MSEKPTIGVIMVVQAKEKFKTKPIHWDITQRAIDTAIKDKNVFVLVVHTGLLTSWDVQGYDNAYNFFNLQESFNYNKFLNRGAKQLINFLTEDMAPFPDYLAFCNNDLVFHTGWSGIVEEMRRKGYRSASPWCPNTHPRYHKDTNQKIIQGAWTRKNLAGWCFIWETALWKELGGLNEDYTFFCSDNATEKQLRENKVAHALFRDFEVTHLGSQTLKTASREFKEFHCNDQVRKWNRENNTNMFNLGK